MTQDTNLSRFFDNIVKQIKAGHRRFYLHGVMTKDEVFFNAQGEVSNLVDSLVFNLIRTPKNDVEKAVILSSDGAILCKKTPRSFDKTKVKTAASITEFLTGSKVKARDGLAGLASKKGRQGTITEASASKVENSNERKGQKQAEQDTSNLNFMITTLNALTQSAAAIPQSYALIFDSFNWEAKLFSKQNHEFDLLKKALKFGEQSTFKTPPLCFYILDKAAALADYVADIEDLPNSILIGLPGIEEIHGALYDYFGEQYAVRDLEQVAKTGRSAQKSLRETVNTVNEMASVGVPSKELDTQFRKSIGFPLENWNWNSIYLPAAVKAKIRNFFDAHNDDNDGEQQKSQGLIFYGPAGTGKTTIAKVLANTEKRSLITAKLADLKGQYIGQTAPKVKALFNSVRSAAPSLLFLDEIETLFPSRGSRDGDSYTKDLVTQFLAESDGVFANNEDFIIVGATNFIEQVDPAVRSRLTPILIDLPDQNSRKAILESGLKKYWSRLSEKSIGTLVQRTQGCSGRDLKNNLIEVIEREIDSAGSEPDSVVEKALESLKDNVGKSLQQGSTGFKLKRYCENGINLGQIIGHAQLKQRLITEIGFLLNPEQLEALNIPVDNGFLLYGPPGNGKTQLANAIANEFCLDMVEVNLGDVLRGRQDVVSNLNDIFERTNRYSVLSTNGVLLFFDEFDALAAKGRDQFRDTFLKKIDSLRNDNSRIVLMAATNFKDRIDDAIIRTGRFDNHLPMKNPSPKECIEIFKLCIPDQFIVTEALSDEAFERLLTELKPAKGFSFSDIKGLANKVVKDVFVKSESSNNQYVITQHCVANILELVTSEVD